MKALEWNTYEVGHCRHPECSVRRGGSWRMAHFPALAFLIRHPQRGAVLFDTGYSDHFFAATERMPERLYRLATPPRLKDGESLASQLERDGIGSDDIGTVVLSHLHGDHAGGLRDFASSTIFCAQEAWRDLARRGRLAATRKGLLHDLLPGNFLQRVHWIEDAPRARLPDDFREFSPGHDLFGDGSLIALHLPGHAAGHYGVFFRGHDSEPILLLADAVWSSRALRDGVPPPVMTTSWLGNTDAYRDTLERLTRLHQAWPGLRMVPSHCVEHRP